MYDTVERATIEKIEEIENGKEITVLINGERSVCQMYTEECLIASISNGEFQELTEQDIITGDCLVQKQTFWDGFTGVNEYRISHIFYFKNS